MKKFNFKKVVTLTALLAVAGLTQACGSSSSGSGPEALTAAVVPGATGVVSPYNGTLYGACSNIQAAETQGTVINSATYTTAADGASVCQVSMETGGSYQGSRAYLGPNAPQEPLNTNMTLDAYDQFQLIVSGTYDTGVFGGCGSNSVSSLMYAYVNGLNVFQVNNSVQQIPANGGGLLEIGLNQSSGSGEMCIEVEVNVTRCVDSSGATHPCA